ncbi:MAG: hypothetical protein CFE41_14195 [Burkholderiales bacterium PBB2]|nr:MAG: hypothetical protein CFE41_14195 [Burkholderiales bacterium PBB2]
MSQAQDRQDLPEDATQELLDDDFETVADYHRLAARHFSAAADHHLAAAAAAEDGEHEATARHAHLAYRHQLHGVQYAEVATLDNDELEDEYLEPDDEVDGEGDERQDHAQ